MSRLHGSATAIWRAIPAGMETVMKAMDVMTHDVVTVGPDTDVSEAAKLLVEHDVSALPVLDRDRRVVGILSEADLMRRQEIDTEKKRPWWLEAVLPAATLADEFARSHGKKVAEVMSRSVISASEDTPLAEIATLLERNRIKRVPIMRDGELVGIVSRGNLIQALASSKSDSSRGDPSGDRAIRLEILARLAKQSWTDFGNRNIIVSDGLVRIWGLVGSEPERHALTALAEGVPGITGVVDEMIPAY
jgi:CBS domain-containing protein